MTIRLGAVRGIGIYLHLTFLLLLVWIGWRVWTSTQDPIAVASVIGLVLLLFVCILLHELGHALMAARFGVPTRDIILLPIGGVARLERMPKDPKQEILVALAGPAVNVAIAGVLLVWIIAKQTVSEALSLSFPLGSFAVPLFSINIYLTLFNMLPAFPMDGGRVLRAALAFRLDYDKATRIAATIGRAMAVLFVVAALSPSLPGGPMLALIGVFVWIGGGQEARMVSAQQAVETAPVGAAMESDIRPAAPTESIGDVARLALQRAQHDVPILEGGRLVGMVLRDDLANALQNVELINPVSDIMRPVPLVLDPQMALVRAINVFAMAGAAALPVVQSGRLVGVLTLDRAYAYLGGAMPPGPPPLPPREVERA